MDNAFDRRMGLIGDGVGQFFCRDRQFRHIGQELARDGIGGIVGIDQRADRGRNRHRIFLGHILDGHGSGSTTGEGACLWPPILGRNIGEKPDRRQEGADLIDKGDVW